MFGLLVYYEFCGDALFSCFGWNGYMRLFVCRLGYYDFGIAGCLCLCFFRCFGLVGCEIYLGFVFVLGFLFVWIGCWCAFCVF